MFAFLSHPDINPVIINIAGPFAIRWYSLMYVLGFLAVYLFLYYLIQKKKILMTKEDLSDIIFIAIIGVLVGGRLGYVLFYNLSYFLQNPLKIFAVWEGGMSFHGGLIFTLLFAWLYIRKKKPNINFLDVADMFLIPVPLALMFGRWGNFVNGELWGRPTPSKIGMVFNATYESQPMPPKFAPDEYISKLDMTAMEVAQKAGMDVSENANLINLPRYPSQLFEMALEGILLFLIMFLVLKLSKHKYRGVFISIFLIGYGLARFIVEFIREPDPQLGYLLGTNWITMGQILSLPMIILGIFGLFLVHRKKVENQLWAQ